MTPCHPVGLIFPILFLEAFTDGNAATYSPEANILQELARDVAAKSPTPAADVTEEVQIVFMTLLIAVVFADVNAKQIHGRHNNPLAAPNWLI